MGLSPEEQVKELGTFSLEERRLSGELIAAFKYLESCHAEDGVGLISVVPEGRLEEMVEIAGNTFSAEHLEKIPSDKSYSIGQR